MTEAAPAARRSWLISYVGAVIGILTPLYLLTRSQLLISDGPARVASARLGDPSDAMFCYITYALPVPLIRTVWLALAKFGMSVSVESVLLGLSLAGTLAAVIFVGLIAAEILGTRRAAWLGAALLGTALNPWTQWNGELSGWAAGFGAAAVFLVLRGRFVAPALLWALAVLSHVDFVLLAPVLMYGIWLGDRSARTAREKVRRGVAFVLLAATSTVVFLLAWSWLFGVWRDTTGLVNWILLPTRFSKHWFGGAEVVRAVKGLVTSFTAAGHHWRNLLTHRGAFDNPAFAPAVAVGFVILAATAIVLVAALRQRRTALFALTWLLPFHVLGNWWYDATQEEYHTGALLGLVLLITAGLVQLGSQASRRWQIVAIASYVAACFGMNLFTALLPMKAGQLEIAAGAREVRELSAEQGGRVALVICDEGPSVVNAGVEFLRIRNIWKGSVPAVEDSITSWAKARLAEGKAVYVQDRRCFPDEWVAPPHPPFDLHVLEQHFRVTKTLNTRLLVPHSSPTDMLAWRRENLIRIESR